MEFWGQNLCILPLEETEQLGRERARSNVKVDVCCKKSLKEYKRETRKIVEFSTGKRFLLSWIDFEWFQDEM